MPFVKNSMNLLLEAAQADLSMNTADALTESMILSSYQDIEETVSKVAYGPNIVPVIKVDGEYYTEMNFLYPYMKSAKIDSIKEALDYVAAANNLEEGAVGLLIESEDSVTAEIEKEINKQPENEAAKSAAKKKGTKKLDKITKAVDKLKKNGIKVKKKASECCKECGKKLSECNCGSKKECGDCNTSSKEECNKK